MALSGDLQAGAAATPTTGGAGGATASVPTTGGRDGQLHDEPEDGSSGILPTDASSKSVLLDPEILVREDRVKTSVLVDKEELVNDDSWTRVWSADWFAWKTGEFDVQALLNHAMRGH